MIDWLIFIPACFALNLTFGPNNLLAMTHGARVGIGFAQRASVGRLLAFVPLIGASALGMGAILTASAVAFTVVKFIGAAYLIWLGMRLLRSSSGLAFDTSSSDTPTPLKAFRTEALVAISNPKAILIFAAFFPQFVNVDNYWSSYLMLGAVFLILESAAIWLYALSGRYARRLAAGNLHWIQRSSGFTMCLFGLLLLASPQPGKH